MGAQVKEIAAWLKEEGSLPSSAHLAEAIERYPYASILHFAYLRSLQNEDSYKFPSQLHRTALSAMDRKALLDWAESPLIPVEIQAAAWKEAQKASQEDKVADKAPDQVAQSTVPKSALEAPKAKETEVAPAAAPVKAPEVHAAAPVPPASQKPVAAPPVLVSTPAKPAGATDLSSINLDTLPPAVREQILRSRAIQAQLGKGSASPASPVLPATPQPSEASPVPPASAVAPSAEHAEKEHAIAPVPASTEDASPENTSEAAKEAVAPVPLEGLVDAPIATSDATSTFALDPTLSPFANFLAGLKEGAPQSSVPAGQRDPAMERAILEQFLEINPKIKPVRDAPMGENLALRTPNVSGLVTETLANHYYDQGMTEKAIQAYEILKLKVPEKSAIFAARISEMRKTQSSTK